MVSEEILETIIQTHEGELLRYAGGLLKDQAAAQDAVQSAMCKLVQANSPLLGNHRAWLFKVVRNYCLNLLRKRRNRGELALEPAMEVANAGASPETAMLEEERRQLLAKCLSRLKPRSREVLLLQMEFGKSYKEIGELTGLSESNVGFILHRTVNELRTMFKEEQSK